MHRRAFPCRAALVGATLLALIQLAPIASAGELLAVRHEDGALYRVSTVDATLTPTIPTAIPFVAAMEMSPDGFVYGFDANPELFRFNPTTFKLEVLGPLAPSLFEGAIAFAPDGTAYIATGNFNEVPEIYRLDVNTLATTFIGVISGGPHDINGLAWRSDGMLVGLDRETNALLTIDPLTAASSILAPLAPTVGAVGGMAVLDGAGYLATAGPGSSNPGSNELWRFDLFSGEHVRIGSFAPTIVFPSGGISGLAAIPEPSLVAIPLGLMLAPLRRQRRQRSL